MKDLDTSKRSEYQTPSKKKVNFDLGYQTPNQNVNNSMVRSSYRASVTASNSKKVQSPAKLAEEDALAKSLKEQLELDKELETCKNELSLRGDFNLLDAFRFFDQTGKGYVTKTELKEGFNHFEIFPTNSESYLIMRKYDRDNDGLLR